MAMYIQCQVCKKASKKDEITGQYGDMKHQHIGLADNVIWRPCADCQGKIQSGRLGSNAVKPRG